MSNISDSVTEPRKKRNRRPPAADGALSVSRRSAAAMLDYGETKIDELVKSGELESFVDGSRARRILTSSIRDYISRKVAASRPRKT